MTDEAYIVANKEQELDVLNKFERKGLTWLSGENPTEWVLSENSLFNFNASFQYALVENENKKIAWIAIGKLTDEEIVYDGRNEENKYKVTEEFMNELIKWRDEYTKSVFGVNAVSLNNMPEIVRSWRFEYNSAIETNKRFGAIVNWINGEEVFKVEYQHKFLVRSKEIHSDGYYSYVKVVDQMALHTDYNLAMKFDTREEAQEWTNSHQVVVEIDEEGNDVE